MIKWILLTLAIVLVCFIGYRYSQIDEVNARIAGEITNNPDGDRARKTMLVTLADGRMYPVNFLHEGNIVYMGIDGRWWREFVDQGQPVELFIRGNTLSGHAKTVLDNPAMTADVFSRLRPTAPAWLPAWLNGKLVVITLK